MRRVGEGVSPIWKSAKDSGLEIGQRFWSRAALDKA